MTVVLLGLGLVVVGAVVVTVLVATWPEIPPMDSTGGRPIPRRRDRRRTRRLVRRG